MKAPQAAIVEPVVMPLYSAPPPPPPPPASAAAVAACPPLVIVEWANKTITDRDGPEFFGEPRGADDSGNRADIGSRAMPFEYQMSHWGDNAAPDAGEINRAYGLCYPHGEILVEAQEREAGEAGSWEAAHGTVVGVRRVWTRNEKWTKGSENGMFPVFAWREQDRATQWQWRVPPVVQYFPLYESERTGRGLRKQILLFTPPAHYAAATRPPDPTNRDESMTCEQRVSAQQTDPLLVGFDAERGWEWNRPLPLRETLRRHRLETKEPPLFVGCMGGQPWQTHVARAANGTSAVAYNLWSKHGTLIFLCTANGRPLKAVLLPNLDATGICAAGKGGWLVEGSTQTRDGLKGEMLRIGTDGSLQARGGYR